MKISLVIPVYNEADSITKALEAVMDQQRPLDEVIVVDNGSSDQTVELARAFKGVKILHEPKRGVVFARNRGFDAAAGDVIGRIDSDTILQPDWSTQIESVFADHELAAVSGPTVYHDMPLKKTSHQLDKQIRKFIFDNMKQYKFLWGANMAITRRAWEAVRDATCHDSDIHEDIDLAIHLGQQGLSVGYEPRLVAATSSRRMEDSFRNFYEYSRMIPRTYERHGVQDKDMATFMMYFWLAVYPTVKMMRRLYDPDAGQLSIKRFIQTQPNSRKNPMSED